MRTFDELLDDLVHRAKWEPEETESAKTTLRRMLADAVAAERSKCIDEEREKWRSIVSRAAADGNRYGREGIAATCMPSETGAWLSWRMDVPA